MQTAGKLAVCGGTYTLVVFPTAEGELAVRTPLSLLEPSAEL